MSRQIPSDPPGSARIKQPNSRSCFACGLENPYGLGLKFYENDVGEVYTEVTLADRYQGYPGIAHGGVLAAVLDEVLVRAAMVGDHNRFMVTARMNLRFLKPVPIALPLRAVGRVVRRRMGFVSAKAEVFLPDGTVAIQAEATMADHPMGEVDPGTLEALGWQVYPDR